jgi:hypothetical protein
VPERSQPNRGRVTAQQEVTPKTVLEGSAECFRLEGNSAVARRTFRTVQSVGPAPYRECAHGPGRIRGDANEVPPGAITHRIEVCSPKETAI